MPSSSLSLAPRISRENECSLDVIRTSSTDAEMVRSADSGTITVKADQCSEITGFISVFVLHDVHKTPKSQQVQVACP